MTDFPLTTAFATPDYTTQSGTAYPLRIDAGLAAVARAASDFQPYVSGGMTVTVAAGTIATAFGVSDVPAQVITLSASPDSGSRIDRIVISAATGMAVLVEGVASPTPSIPAIPSDMLPCARVIVAAGVVVLANAMGIDERALSTLGVVAGTASKAGLLALATPTEAAVGTDATKAVTSAGVLASILANTVQINPGTVLPFAFSSPPTGWLKANGAAISRTSYAALFAAIGTTFGAGDGSTTFTLPDLRGEFLRGWDDGRGVDVQAMTGTTTTGSTAITALADTQTLYVGQSITGAGIPAGATIAAITSSTAITISAAATATASSVSLTFVGRAFGSRQGDAIRNITGALSPTHAPGNGGVATGAIGKIAGAGDSGASNSGEARLGFDFDASRVVPTAPEVRVRNIAFLTCIKY